MKKIRLMCLVLTLLGAIPHTLVWARGGGGGGGHGGGGFGGGHGGGGFGGGHMGGGGWGHGGGGGHHGGMHYGGGEHFGGRVGYYRGGGVGFYRGGGFGHYRGPRGFYRGYGYGLGYGFGGYGLGLGLGYGLGYGIYGYGPSYYAYPPSITVPAAPMIIYIERQDVPQQNNIQHPAQLQPNYWYYCRAPEGYYPYVKNCPDGWEQVAPQPPAQ